MMLRAPAAFLFAALLSGAASAAEPQVYRLTPAERDAAIAAAAQRPESPGGALLPDPARDRILGNSLYGNESVRDNKPHGEVGMFVGSGGARGIYGTTGIPLGNNGYAQFSFGTGQMPGFSLSPYDSNPYGLSPYGANPYGLQPFGRSPPRR